MDWLGMGKYGFFVWSSFGLTALVMLACVLQARHRHRRVVRDLLRQIDLRETEE